VYAEIGFVTRLRLPGRIVQALESGLLISAETSPEILAHHCTNAGLVEKAISYWLAAAMQAMKRSALLEAIAQLQKGLDLVGDLADGSDRDSHELNLQLALGGALIAAKGYAAEIGRQDLCEGPSAQRKPS